jgi:peptide deformylase
MAVRPVLTLPHAVLSTRAVAVGSVDDGAVALGRDLLDTMRAAPACVGLAAPQIGVGRRALSVDVSGHRKARSCQGAFVLFDPEIVAGAEPRTEREGCMSVPDLTGDVERFGVLVVAGTGLDGARVVLEVDAFEARAVQHELDHLDGLLFLDRVSGPHAVFPRKVYR